MQAAVFDHLRFARKLEEASIFANRPPHKSGGINRGSTVMNESNFPEHIRYHYTSDSDANLKVAHGVWGGVNPHGEIEICFYNESDIPPEITDQTIGADGTPGPERVNQPDSARHIERRIHSRILVNYNTARALLDWLSERVSELDAEGATEIYDFNSGIQQ